ncbi:MAG: GNAT family protein [Steroidobacteraceae bacterium]
MDASPPRLNALGQPIGAGLPDFRPPPRPAHAPIEGRWCRLEPLSAARHASDLWRAYSADAEGRVWTYLASGPFASDAEFAAFIAGREPSTDPLFFAIVDGATGRAAGIASYLRIEPAHGSIEVGHLAFAPALQRTRAATEAMYLMMRQAFDLGYRRYEWKCDALNAPSRRAAGRLGFTYEGTFRQATVYKGRNRDTAWYSVIDAEWPARRRAFEAWLAPANFDEQGRQRRPLAGD